MAAGSGISWYWGRFFDDKNFCTHFIGIQQDITQQRANSEYIARQQTHDSLTGLINHHTFEEILDTTFHFTP